jgi:hypothetical protein
VGEITVTLASLLQCYSDMRLAGLEHIGALYGMVFRCIFVLLLAFCCRYPYPCFNLHSAI